MNRTSVRLLLSRFLLRLLKLVYILIIHGICLLIDYLDEEDESDFAVRLSVEMLPFLMRQRLVLGIKCFI